MRQLNTTRINRIVADIADREGLGEAMSSTLASAVAVVSVTGGLSDAAALSLSQDLSSLVARHLADAATATATARGWN